jgi:ketosteroid isomerase-like protein
MSKRNIEILEQQHGAFNRRDVDAMTRQWHPDGRYRSTVAALEGANAVYRGRDGIRAYLNRLDELFDGWRVVAANYVEAGNDRVVSIQHVTARAKRSGVPIDQQLAVVYTFRDGLIVSGRAYSTPQEAMEALGLT